MVTDYHDLFKESLPKIMRIFSYVIDKNTPFLPFHF